MNLTDFVFRSIYGFDRVVPLPPLERPKPDSAVSPLGAALAARRCWFRAKKPLFNIAPKSFAPIVRFSSTGEIEQVFARWGLVPASFPTLEHANRFNMTNARAETVRESNAFKHAYRSRRCLLPSNGFYEWRRFDDGKKWPYLIGLDDLEPLAYAGIWECWEREDKVLESFSILTTTPNKLMVRIHDRMPVILAQTDWQTWLDPQASLPTLEGLLVPYPARGMEAFLVSPKVGSVKASGPELLEPLR